MQAISRIFSTLLSPLLMPTYIIFLALWATVLRYLPTGTRVVVLLVVCGITCLLPMMVIAIMHNLKIIDDRRLVDRRERLLPYMAATLCYVGAGVYLTSIHMQQWAVAPVWGAAAACAAALVVNLWWKISAHMTGIGGLLAFAVSLRSDGLGAADMQPVICALILLSGALGTSRIYLDRHSFWQVVAGFALGFALVTCASLLLS